MEASEMRINSVSGDDTNTYYKRKGDIKDFKAIDQWKKRGVESNIIR
jgi:hypothetical protein